MAEKRFSATDFDDFTTDANVGLLKYRDESYIALKLTDEDEHSSQLFTGDGITVSFTATPDPDLRPGTIQISRSDSTLVFTDNGDGTFPTGTSTGLAFGSVNYQSGAIALIFLDGQRPTNGELVLATYKRDVAEIQGEGYELRSGEVIFPNWTGRSIEELFSFVVADIQTVDYLSVGTDRDCFQITVLNPDSDGAEVDLTSIDFQLSNDGGTTWKYIDTSVSPAVWTDVAGISPEPFSSKTDVDANIGTLGFDASSGRKQLRVKMRLNPDSGGLLTPIVRQVRVGYEAPLDPEEDFLRSLKLFLQENVRVREVLGFNLGTATSSVTMAVDEDDTTVTYDGTPVAYNLTDDPGRTTNIGATIGSPDTLFFDSDQTGRVECHVDATIPVFIGIPDEPTELSTVRAIIIEIDDTIERSETDAEPSNSVYEFERSQSRYRTRTRPAFLQFEVKIMCQAPRARQALAMRAAVRRLLDETNNVLSVGVGENYHFVNQTRGGESDDIGGGISTQDILATFTGELAEGSYQTTVMASQIGLKFRKMGPRLPGTAPLREDVTLDEDDVREGRIDG